MTNSLNTPIEALEYAYPFRVLRYAYRRGSGGEGTNCGGDGLIREIELLAPAQVTLLTERRVFPPYGLHGGLAGRVAAMFLSRTEPNKSLPGKCNIEVKAGDDFAHRDSRRRGLG